MTLGGEWSMDYPEEPERLKRDEAPTQGDSGATSIKSHRSLSGLDERSDKWSVFGELLFYILLIAALWVIVIGIVGGFWFFLSKVA